MATVEQLLKEIELIGVSLQVAENAKSVLEKAKESLEKHKKIIHRMEEGENIRLGIRDSWDWFSYHPCEYVKTLDIKKCIVQVYEPGIDKFHKGHVSRFLI